MDLNNNDASASELSPGYDRKSELKAFDETKEGVKGLVDSGITKVPRIFHIPSDHFDKISSNGADSHFSSIPIIDLQGIDADPILRKEAVERIGNASKTWGYFQVVNHGIDPNVLQEMLDGVRRFFEQDPEIRKKLYSRDPGVFNYNSNFDLYTSEYVNWRDTFTCGMYPTPPNPEELPEVCRDVMFEYSEKAQKLEVVLFELLSEALGLKRNHIQELDCTDSLVLVCHYYPECPEPELTMGSSSHTDKSFLTLILQDQLGGLQILHENKWVDVPPVPGAIVVNIADMLQLVSNGKFKSPVHRVVANRDGPRISVASSIGFQLGPKLYGPIKELLSEDDPPIYRETTVFDQATYFLKNVSIDVRDPLRHLKINIQ